MKKEQGVRYEKPTLTSYAFFGVVNGDGDADEEGNSQGGDMGEGCDSDFDE